MFVFVYFGIIVRQITSVGFVIISLQSDILKLEWEKKSRFYTDHGHHYVVQGSTKLYLSDIQYETDSKYQI